MVVIAKITTGKKINFVTFQNEEDGFDFLQENSGTADIELLVDVSEVKHYKDRYFEAYKSLFCKFSKNPVISENKDELITSVKYYSYMDNIEKMKTFSSFQKATDFIDEELLDTEDYGSIQVLVNIAQVLDYKEKYDEFYNLLLEQAIKDESF